MYFADSGAIGGATIGDNILCSVTDGVTNLLEEQTNDNSLLII